MFLEESIIYLPYRSIFLENLTTTRIYTDNLHNNLSIFQRIAICWTASILSEISHSVISTILLFCSLNSN